ncbi:MAG: hypothetical protein KAI17_08710 [Thiotrichaceae bacterium]|nr:hypothetical protein [Thiotrichaceae bacterium]
MADAIATETDESTTALTSPMDIDSGFDTDAQNDFNLGNAAALLDGVKADKVITDTKEALENVAGLLEEHIDSVEQSLIHNVENTLIKEPVPRNMQYKRQQKQKRAVINLQLI